MTGTQLGTVGLLVIFPVLAAIVGSVLPALRPPGARLVSGVQHFAAGAVVAAIALDVLPAWIGRGTSVLRPSAARSAPRSCSACAS